MKYSKLIEKAYDSQRLHTDELGGNYPAFKLGAEFILRQFNLNPDDEFQETQQSEQTIISFSDGKKVVLNPYVADVYEEWQKLEPFRIIEMFDIDEDAMQGFIDKRKVELKANAIALLSKKWIVRETGQKACFDDFLCEYIWGIKKSGRQILTAIKKDKLTDLQMKSIINYFENGGEVREKNEFDI